MLKVQIPSSLKLALWSVPLTLVFFIPSVSDSFNLTKLLLLLVFAASALILLIFERGRARNSISIKQSPGIALALYSMFVLTIAISGWIGTENPIRFFWGTPGRANGILYYLSIIVICVVILIGWRNIHLDYFLRVFSYGFLAVIGYSLIQFVGLDPVQWSNPYNRILGTLGNPNFSASALGIIGAYFSARFILDRRVGGKLFNSSALVNLALALLSGFLAWSTESLQGPVVFIVGISILILRELLSRIRVGLLKVAIMAFALSLTFAISISMAGLGPLASQLQQYTLTLRSIYASIGLKAMLSQPLTGYGVDSYLIAFREFRTLDFVNTYGTGTLTNNAHSTPFQIGAVFGLAPFILYLALILLVLYKVFIIFKKNGLERDKKIEIVAILWLLTLFQSLLSIEQIGLGVIYWILGAILLAHRTENHEEAKLSRPNQVARSKQAGRVIGGEIGVLLLVFLAIPTTFFLRQDAAWRSVAALQIQGESDKTFVQGQMEKMGSFILSEPEKLGPLLQKLYDSGLREQIEPLVIECFRVNPKDYLANELMSQLLRDRGDSVGELKQLNAMTSLDPWNSLLWLRMGEVNESLGNKELAKQALARVLQIDKSVEMKTKVDTILEKINLDE